MTKKYVNMNDITPKIQTKMVERLIAEHILRNVQIIESPHDVYQSFADTKVKPIYESDGQFCGIESEWYVKGNLVYKFVFEGCTMIDATTENYIENTK